MLCYGYWKTNNHVLPLGRPRFSDPLGCYQSTELPVAWLVALQHDMLLVVRSSSGREQFDLNWAISNQEFSL